jgi:large subunit ribosomal protein L23
MAEVKDYYGIIKSILITEKGTKISAPLRQHIFCVQNTANKIQIRNAVEKIYNVKVQKVMTLIVKGKTKRLRQNQPGKTRAWKKAIVTLKEGSEIKPS